MDQALARCGRAEVRAGLDALRRSRPDDAGTHFRQALEQFEAIEDASARRAELGVFAMACDRTGFHDLSTAAATAAIQADAVLADRRHLAQDLLTLGNARLHQGRTAPAARHYREALRLCLEVRDYPDAAAAVTNLAVVAAGRGDTDEAIRLLRAGLRYLEREPSPATEIVTRLALVQILDAAAHGADEVIEAARPLFSRLGDHLRAHHRARVVGPLRVAIGRHLATHRELDGERWARTHFPGVLD